MALKDSLLAHLRKVQSVPYLFVGAGLSRRYLGLEGWEGLLRRFAAETKKPFDYYRSKAHSNYPAIGSALAADFNEVWFASAKYKASRATFGARCSDDSSALKYEISEYMKAAAAAKTRRPAIIQTELDLLAKATIEGIITTNWDQHLEEVFPDFKAFVGQDQLLFGTLAGVAEIYKIHGCVTDPGSLVLTAEDYADFNGRNAYLVAKLLSVFVEHPVIFLGYSLQDDNVQGILKAIAHCLTDRNILALQDRLIFIEWSQDGNDAALTQSSRVFDGIPIPVYTARVSDYRGIFEALGQLKRKIPVRLLRMLKEQVYELVQSNDPKGKIAVADFDTISKGGPVEFAIGIGPMSGKAYEAITRHDLMRDVLEDDGNYDPAKIVEKVLPNLAKGRTAVPVNKYLRAAGYFAENKALFAKLPSGIRERANLKFSDFSPKAYEHRRATLNTAHKNLASLLKRVADPREVLVDLCYLDQGKLDVAALRAFLQTHAHWTGTFEKSHYCKMVCLLDWLEFGKHVA